MNKKRLWPPKSLQLCKEGKRRIQIPEIEGEKSKLPKKATNKMLEEKKDYINCNN